jgi:galactosylceramidase
MLQLVDPNGQDFTITIAKISHDHAPCTRPALPSFDVSEETVMFQLASTMGRPARLAVWYSNFENYTADAPLFSRLSDIIPAADGSFTVFVPVGSFFTISTILNGPTKGNTSQPASEPFPMPYSDDFLGYTESQEARWLSDQIGAFEIHPEDLVSGNRAVLRQMVPELPIGWSDHGTNGPVTVLGMREWNDVEVNVTVKLPPPINGTHVAGCVGVRSDQSWDKCVPMFITVGTVCIFFDPGFFSSGIVFCVYTDSTWTLSIGGPSQATGATISLFVCRGWFVFISYCR